MATIQLLLDRFVRAIWPLIGREGALGPQAGRAGRQCYELLYKYIYHFILQVIYYKYRYRKAHGLLYISYIVLYFRCTERTNIVG